MKNSLLIGTAGCLTVLFISVQADAQGGANGSSTSGPPVLAKELVTPRANSRLLVTSSAFQPGGSLNDRYTQNGANVSPPIAWTKGPAGTQSYVLLAEDAGVNRPEPVFHWVVYDIPSTVRAVSGNQPTDAELTSGAMQGLNVRKAAGFLGPKPPAGQTHPYHFEVFALDTKLHLDPTNTDRNAVVAAMKDHVLAEGDIVANYTGK
jgi:Raf kinase inhibitor-like YbhB/YbcL family protein